MLVHKIPPLLRGTNRIEAEEAEADSRMQQQEDEQEEEELFRTNMTTTSYIDVWRSGHIGSEQKYRTKATEMYDVVVILVLNKNILVLTMKQRKLLDY